MPKEQSNLEATQEELLAQTEKGLAGLEEPTQVEEGVSLLSGIPLGAPPKPEPEEKPVSSEAMVEKGEPEPEPEAVKPKTPEESVSPESQEDVVESFNKRANERLASLAVTPEADDEEKAELRRLMDEKGEIEGAMEWPKNLLQEIEDTEQALGKLELLEPVEEGVIRAVSTEIRELRIIKERLEEELEAAGKEREAWIGTPEKAKQTQAAYEELEMAISEEEERLLKQNEAQREQYEEEKQAAQEAKQRLTIWKNYLENEAEIRRREREYENKIRVLSEERERANTEEEKAFYAKRIAVWKGQLTRLRKKIPQDIDDSEGEPKSEIEGMYREVVREMRGEKVERREREVETKEPEVEKPVEEPTVELSEEEKTAQAKQHWQVVMEIVASEGAFKEDLTDEGKEALEKELASLEELASYPEKINQLRTVYDLPREE